jgi:Tfp pilus assembly protein PilE
MKMVRSVTALVATTMLATSVTPAMAQGFPGGFPGGGYGNSGRGWNDGYRRHHRNRGVSAGDVIAGVAIIGVIAAIASAASKSKNQTNDRDYRGNINSEDQAADACAARVEQYYGNNARVRSVDDVQRTRDRYSVRGTVNMNEQSNRDDRGTQRFTCSIRFGQVDDVRVDDGIAYRGY